MMQINYPKIKSVPKNPGVYPVRGRGSLRNIFSKSRPKLKKLPTSNGVYFFRDKSGKILYIGKAVNLKARVGSYFNKQPKDSRISKMLELAKKVHPVRGREGAQRDPASYGVTWQETDSEIEALILESQLIKKHRPPFNVMLRDDKQYFYVTFSDDEFPKVVITHRPESYRRPKISNFKYQISNEAQNSKSKKKWKMEIGNWKFHSVPAEWVGPFTDGGALKTTLRLLRRIFPYCTCKQKHNNYCLNYHIGKCLGFCCLKRAGSGSQRQEYLKNIKSITGVLEGKRTSVIKNFKKEMLAFGKKHDFEKAIDLRDKIEKLEKVFENARIVRDANTRMHANDTNKKEAIEELKKILKLPYQLHRIEGYDISNIHGKFATGAMVVFVDGLPDKSQYRKFKIRLGDEPNLPRRQAGDVAMLEEVLTRRFNHPEWQYPDLIIVDGGIGQLNATCSVIPKNIPVIALTKNDKHRGDHVYLSNKKTAIPLAKLSEPVRNLILQVDAEAHRFAISYYRKLHSRSQIQKL